MSSPELVMKIIEVARSKPISSALKLCAMKPSLMHLEEVNPLSYFQLLITIILKIIIAITEL